jgi:sugar phosphate isomerase/epimerase
MARLDRRSFLILSGAAAAASFTKASLAAPTGFAAGIQLYAVRDELAKDAPGTFKGLHEIGFTEVESAGYGKFTAKDYRKFADDAGIKIPSAHVNLNNPPDISAIFADVNTLGAHYATSSTLFSMGRPGGGRPAPGTPMPAFGVDGFNKIAEHMNQVGTAAKAAGLQYAYHNHNVEFEKLPDGTVGYDILLKETDKDLVKFEIDCGWMTISGNSPVSYLQKYPGRFRMIHVKDFKQHAPTTDLMGGDRPEGVELGHGFIDYKPIYAAAKKAGVEHTFAEQEGPYLRPQLASAKVSYDYMKSVS